MRFTGDLGVHLLQVTSVGAEFLVMALPRTITVAALAFASVRPALAEELFLRSREVEVDGVADIRQGKVAEAREAAIKSAQRSAIEQVAGTLIESRLSVEQRETSAAGRSELFSRVEDKLDAGSSGVIERQDIIREKRDGGTYLVRLRVVVKTDTLEAELAKLAALQRAVGYPKIMLLVGERYRSGKEERRIERPALTPILEHALLEKGFELVDKEREPSEGDAVASLSDTGRAAEVAARYGAEAAIVGTAEVGQTAYNEGGDRMYYVAAVINLRAVNVSTGKVITSVEEVAKSAGASEEIARVKALRAGAPKVIEAFLTQLARSWQGEVERGKRFRVNLVEVASYGKHGRPFLALLREVPGVSAVKELAFNSGKLELEVLFKGTKEELLDGVFTKAEGNERFKTLDKAKDRGDEVDLHL